MTEHKIFILTLCVNNCFIIALSHISLSQPTHSKDTNQEQHLLRIENLLLNMSSVLARSSSLKTKNTVIQDNDLFDIVHSDHSAEFSNKPLNEDKHLPEIVPEETNIPEIVPEETHIPEIVPEETHIPEIVPASCINTGENLVKKFTGVWNVWYCQRHCRNTEGCQYMTFYSNLTSPRLDHSCYLFSSCLRRNEDCRGCLSASNNTDIVLDQCKVPPLRGGTWACTHNVTAEGKVWDGTTCAYICAGVSTAITCHHGAWDREVGSLNCHCNVTDGMDKLACWPRVEGGVVEGGTVCTKTCGVKEYKATCKDKHWDKDLASVECVDWWMALLTALLVLVAVAVMVCLCVAFLLGYDRRHLKPRESHA